ncbi:MAG: chorismate-binding protein [Flavobacteriales bacterium]|nr:chorismate-binding protein [Flavobacteriales bacterium]MCB9197037.1 chorismate-binding protein [Flavobacteriales bacterium]
MEGFYFFREPGAESVHGFSASINSISNIDCFSEDFVVTNLDKTAIYSFKNQQDLNIDELDRIFSDLKLDDLKPAHNVSFHEYQRIVNEAIKFGQGNRKVVVSRVRSRSFDYSKGLKSAFLKLCNRYDSAFVYLFYIPGYGLWIGATPEVLVKGKLPKLEIYSLAGSRNTANPFKWTSKEYEEQEIVTNEISSRLNSLGVTFKIGRVETVQAGQIEHLRTVINVESFQPMNLVNELHPTAAVCGHPRQEALRFIRENEKHNREFYTGVIGWKQDSELALYVNLRCARIDTQKIHCFAGGGITEKSDVIKEWEETNFKTETLLSVLEKK